MTSALIRRVAFLFAVLALLAAPTGHTGLMAMPTHGGTSSAGAMSGPCAKVEADAMKSAPCDHDAKRPCDAACTMSTTIPPQPPTLSTSAAPVARYALTPEDDVSGVTPSPEPSPPRPTA